MILDADLILSDAQAETTVAAHASTNVVDFGAPNVGHNNKVIVTVNTAVTSDGSGTVLFTVETDDNADFTSATALYATAAIAKTTLVAGYRVLEFTLPYTVERYVRVTYTIGTAALTAGKFNAYIDNAIQTNNIG